MKAQREILHVLEINPRYKCYYRDATIEVHKIGERIRFYEIHGNKRICLTKEHIKWMVKHRRFIGKERKIINELI
jgi:hypothetical protein